MNIIIEQIIVNDISKNKKKNVTKKMKQVLFMIMLSNRAIDIFKSDLKIWKSKNEWVILIGENSQKLLSTLCN